MCQHTDGARPHRLPRGGYIHVQRDIVIPQRRC
jgi:hypothetical protein